MVRVGSDNQNNRIPAGEGGPAGTDNVSLQSNEHPQQAKTKSGAKNDGNEHTYWQTVKDSFQIDTGTVTASGKQITLRLDGEKDFQKKVNVVSDGKVEGRDARELPGAQNKVVQRDNKENASSLILKKVSLMNGAQSEIFKDSEGTHIVAKDEKHPLGKLDFIGKLGPLPIPLWANIVTLTQTKNGELKMTFTNPVPEFTRADKGVPWPYLSKTIPAPPSQEIANTRAKHAPSDDTIAEGD